MDRVVSGDGVGRLTAAAGTAIVAMLRHRPRLRTRLAGFQYTNTAGSAVAHAMTVMRAIGRTTLAADAAGAAVTVVLTADPGPTGNLLAVGDYLVIDRPGMIPLLRVITGWNVGTLTATIAALPAEGAPAGSVVFNYGVPADTDPTTGAAHPTVTLPAAAVTTWAPYAGLGYFGAGSLGEPLILHVDNPTVAGVLNHALFWHTAEGVGTAGALPGGGDDQGQDDPDARP